jgi:hypothetical protein
MRPLSRVFSVALAFPGFWYIVASDFVNIIKIIKLSKRGSFAGGHCLLIFEAFAASKSPTSVRTEYQKSLVNY